MFELIFSWPLIIASSLILGLLGIIFYASSVARKEQGH